MVGLSVVAKDTRRVVETECSMAVCLAVRSAESSVASTAVLLVDRKDELSVDLMDYYWVAERVALTDTSLAVVLVGVMDALLVAAMDALMAVHWVEHWAGEMDGMMVVE